MLINNRLLFATRNFSRKQLLTGEVEPFAVQRQQQLDYKVAKQTTKATLTRMSTNRLRNNGNGYARAL